MEHYRILQEEAEQKLKTADHLLTTTYSLVKEPKLLMSAIEKIFESLDLIITAAIEYEKNSHSIPAHDKSFDGKFEIFRRKIATKYNISQDTLKFIADIKNTLDSHKKSDVEFSKKDKFIITDEHYNVNALSIDKLKKELTSARHTIDQISKIMRL